MLNLRELTARLEYEPVGSTFEATWLLYLLHKHYFPSQYRERLRLKPPALLKLKLKNRFPRCYPTRRLAKDNSLYYGPFPSQAAAERFASEFLDFFKIRRCSEELNPDPSHPGCIYSQLHMCLAPCFAGCTDAAYQDEVQRVVEFLNTQGKSLLRGLEAERAQASESLEFECAAKAHQRIDKLNELLRQRPDLVRNVNDLHAVVVLPGAEPNAVTFFRIVSGEIRGPVSLSLDENVPNPTPLDRRLLDLMDLLAGGERKVCPHAAAQTVEMDSRLRGNDGPSPGGSGPQGDAGGAPPECRHSRAGGNPPPCGPEPSGGGPHQSMKSPRAYQPASLPPWEHLSLLARWYYSSFREGELVMLNPNQAIPLGRLIRACRKVLAFETAPSTPANPA